MLSYILRRLALMVPTLIGMTLLVFVVVRYSPGITSGGGGNAEMASQSRAEQEAMISRRLHLDKPVLVAYGMWLWDTVHGDFGESIQYHTPVMALLEQRLPVTFAMGLLSTIVIYVVSIPTGLMAAARRGRAFDVGWSFFSLAFFSLPIIWVGDLLLAFLANPQYLGWFPVAGGHATSTDWMTSFQYAKDFFWHMVLPVVCLSYGGFAYLSKLQRATILDNLSMDYVRTANAKGLSGRVVMLRHVFRNSLLPMITVSAGVIPGLIGGAVVTERIFSIKGMGELFLTATTADDLPVIQAVTVITSVISLLSLLLTDLCYAMADPRVSYE